MSVPIVLLLPVSFPRGMRRCRATSPVHMLTAGTRTQTPARRFGPCLQTIAHSSCDPLSCSSPKPHCHRWESFLEALRERFGSLSAGEMASLLIMLNALQVGEGAGEGHRRCCVLGAVC